MGVELIESHSLSEKLIGVVGVRREITPILQRMTETETERTGLARFHRGRMHGHALVAVEIGVGKVNAAAATQSLIDRYRPTCLLFTGSAGGLSPDVSVGDVIIADCVTVHDVGAHRSGGFSPTGFMLLSDDGDQNLAHRICAPAELVALAERVADTIDWGLGQDNRPLQIHVGPVVTGDQVIVSADKKEWLTTTFEALVVEMEGSAFAQVAWANELPWLLIRSVSDHANHHFDFAFELWQDYIDDPQTTRSRLARARDRLAYMVKDPQAMIRAKRFLDNMAYAAGNAARLTEAVILALE